MPNPSDSHRNREKHPSRHRTRLLVVDDNPDNVLTLSRLLQMCGFEVMTACEGRTALEIAGQFRPEFALLDIGLPSWDGYEVARRLRAEAGLESTTFIAVTAYGTDEDRRRSREAGFVGHLVKPISPAELLALLSRSEAVDS